ncbi:MAG: hypothetical protein WC809_04130 [Sinimarinibacterium sp.]|jgi:hypothetical protein
MNISVSARTVRTILALGTLAAAAPAAAYVGPGAGLSLLGALWAVIATIAAALFFLLMWPLRRLIRRFAGNHAPAARPDASMRSGDPRTLSTKRVA